MLNSNNKRILLLILCSFLVIASNVYALDLNKAREYFVKCDYKETIRECENILAYKGYSKDLDELYYILALSYMKQENLLRASDIFEIIINEFKGSSFKESAMLGLADTYFLRKDYANAQSRYKALLDKFAQARFKSVVYYRLAQISMKQGSKEQAREYLDRLKKECPLSFESRMDIADTQQEPYFTIQVGAFSKSANAQKLCNILAEKGYKPYIEEIASGTYKVRVGKLPSRIEAEQLKRQLANEGYPTKIIP